MLWVCEQPECPVHGLRPRIPDPRSFAFICGSILPYFRQNTPKPTMIRREIDSPYAWFRLAVSVLLSAIGGVGMWSVVVALPAVQADFHAERGAASLPFTLTMIGFGIGGVIMGRLADRRGIILAILIRG